MNALFILFFPTCFTTCQVCLKTSTVKLKLSALFILYNNQVVFVGKKKLKKNTHVFLTFSSQFIVFPFIGYGLPSSPPQFSTKRRRTEEHSGVRGHGSCHSTGPKRV